MKRTILLISVPFVLFTWLFYGLTQKACNSAMQIKPAKKIPFMHKTHIVKYDIKDCTTCHKYDENGRFRGIPSVGDCTACHARDGELTAKDHLTPRKKSMFDDYKDTDKPWGSWAQQPDLVYFSHKVVMTAKFEDGKMKAQCGQCHGDKAMTTDTGMLKGKMLMGQCMNCHTALQISNKCAVCHK